MVGEVERGTQTSIVGRGWCKRGISQTSGTKVSGVYTEPKTLAFTACSGHPNWVTSLWPGVHLCFADLQSINDLHAYTSLEQLTLVSLSIKLA